MRQYIVTLLAVLLVACGDNPTDPPEEAANQLRVLNGPATCDACDEVEFTVAGPGLNKVIDASLKHHGTGEEIGTSAEIRHFVGDSGAVLLIKLDFLSGAPTGDYDLRLHTVETGGAQASLNIPVAVKIISPPNDPDSPTPPPGPTGIVRVNTITSGPVPPEPYLVTVDPCDAIYVCPGRNVAANASMYVQLNPGSYTLALDHVPASCTVAPPHSVSVTVVAGQTVNVSFRVACVTAPTGSIRISAPTTGAIPGSPYEAIVEPCDLLHPCRGSVSPGGAGTIVQVPGNYTVTLGNVPASCTVGEPRSVPATVTANQTVDVSFSVTCAPAGTVRVTATVTGPDPDENFIVLEGGCDWYYDDCNLEELSVGGSAVFSLAPGTYTISLFDVATNCSVAAPHPRTVTVAANVQTDVAFAVTCVGIANIRVSTLTTGLDKDLYYAVEVSDCAAGYTCSQGMEASGTLEFNVPSGTHTVRLTQIAENCTVNGANPVLVTTPSGSTVNVAFQVTCTALPFVRVTAPTSGTNPDAAYIVVNETECDYYSYYCSQQVLPAAGAAEFKLTPGSYVFRLTDIASNCTVTGPNPVTVNVVLGVNSELAFPVSCQ